MSGLMGRLLGMDPGEVAEVLRDLSPAAVEALLDEAGPPTGPARQVAPSPLDHALELDPAYRSRPHLRHLSDRLAAAVADVESGVSRFLIVSMPPRLGKSLLTSVFLPTWLLMRHPGWKIGLVSHSPDLAASWGRQVRSMVSGSQAPGLAVAPDAGAVVSWRTTAGGGVWSRSAPGQSLTGLGFNVLLMDDLVRDHASAHSEKARAGLWEWWQSNALTRLEPPSLVVAIGTRWHEDDFLGRLVDEGRGGDAGRWEQIVFPAVAEQADVLGREPGQPLYSPLVDESESEALERWAEIRQAVGAYTWSALYQQRPSPARGAIFDMDAWRFWTRDPARVSVDADGRPDGQVVLLPQDRLSSARWVDSWDAAFKGEGADVDFVVGQRWARLGPNRFLVAQQRGRWTFTQTLERIRAWASPSPASSPFGHLVHERLIEDKANGPAIIDTLRREVSGVRPVNPRTSKEARARAVTPEIESHHVFLPHPSEPGYGWVADFLDEFREFPNGVHDDQVDALTQALSRLRDVAPASSSVPGGVRISRQLPESVGRPAGGGAGGRVVRDYR